MMNNYNAVYVKTLDEATNTLDNYTKLYAHFPDYTANIKWDEKYEMYHVTCTWTKKSSFDV